MTVETEIVLTVAVLCVKVLAACWVLEAAGRLVRRAVCGRDN